MPDDEYPPESIRVLAGLEPPVRDPNDPRVRWCREFLEPPREPLLPVTSDRVQAALESIMRDIGLTEAQIRTRFPIALGERVALRAEDLSDREMALIMASTMDGPAYSLDDIPDDAGAPGGVAGGARKPAGEPGE
ncbi:hypothetical protein [Methylobacterium sp. SI9]|uniref:hypothetical protein n=1 Tax=Methylobacterium guangdongense TaxID=3138811 RepID=UPI00313E0727